MYVDRYRECVCRKIERDRECMYTDREREYVCREIEGVCVER